MESLDFGSRFIVKTCFCDFDYLHFLLFLNNEKLTNGARK